MSNSLLFIFQILSYLVTVIGLGLAFWHVWVLASKLRRFRGDAAPARPAPMLPEESDRRIHLQTVSDRAAHVELLQPRQTVSDRAADAAMPRPRRTATSLRSR